MYHIVVEQTQRQMSELVQDENDYSEVFHEDPSSDFVEFSVGNPRVEHITGLVHLYKRNTAPHGSARAFRTSNATRGSGAAQASAGQEVDFSRTVCCLAIPADMSVAHFCSFIGAYLREVSAIQVLRREGAQRSVCMVLLTFPDQEKADSFYSDFNGLPFSSLEPDILCRLVFVRSVEVISARGRPSLDSVTATAATITGSSTVTKSSNEAVPTGDQVGSNNAPAPQTPTRASTSTATASADSTSSSNLVQSVVAADGNLGSSSKSEIAPAADTEAEAAAPDVKQKGRSSSSPNLQQESLLAQNGPDGGTTPHSYAAAAAAGTPAAATAAAAASKPTAADSGVQANEIAVAAAAAPYLLWLEPRVGSTELPTCPVCLERLDEHISGIVMTVCNHRFHGECLKRWGDTSCPVCRYCMYSSNTNTSRCSTCGTNANLWICLICGHVGCGRYKQGHANDHWQESAHCYALELETQRVWDYAGDGYVHRLIQSKTDGKLVEVPSPAPHACPHRSPRTHHRHNRHNRSNTAGSRLDRANSGCSGTAGNCSTDSAVLPAGDRSGTDDEECPICTREQQQLKDALVTSKLDAITLEYNYLLTTQLDSQRQYFESMLAQQEAKHQQQVAAAKAAAEQEAAAREAAAAATKEKERKHQQLQRKLSELSTSVAKVGEEREFLRSLNETLLANQKDYSTKLKAAQASLAEKDAQLQDLQEQVRDLMVYIEAQQTIESAGGELQDATLLPVPEGQKPIGHRRRNRK